MNIHTESFNEVEVWVQIWNLPGHCLSKEVGTKLGKLFSQINDIMIPEFGSSKGRYIRILATLNLDKALLRGTNIRLNDEVHWADFKYEQIAAFCYYCGKIGHSDKLLTSELLS